MAIVGPETNSSAIRSRPMPVSRKRPSATGRGGHRRRQQVEPLPGVIDATILGPGQPGRQVAIKGEPDVLDLDPCAGDRPAFQVDDPTFDRRSVGDQPDRQLARGAGLADGRGPAGPEPRGRGDDPGKQCVAPVQVGLTMPARHPHQEPAVRPAGCLGRGPVVAIERWVVSTTAPATGRPSGSTTRPRTSIIAPDAAASSFMAADGF